jgi:hypothetical protein
MLRADARLETAIVRLQPAPDRPRCICGILPRRDRTAYDAERAARTPLHRRCRLRHIDGRCVSIATTSDLSNLRITSRGRRIPDRVECSGPSAPDCHGIPSRSSRRCTYYRSGRSSDRRKWRPDIVLEWSAWQFLLAIFFLQFASRCICPLKLLQEVAVL